MTHALITLYCLKPYCSSFKVQKSIKVFQQRTIRTVTRFVIKLNLNDPDLGIIKAYNQVVTKLIINKCLFNMSFVTVTHYIWLEYNNVF